MKKYLVVNFKTYLESFDKEGEKILREISKCQKKAKKKNVEIIICPNILDLKQFSTKFNFTFFSQDVSTFNYGAHTGFVIEKFLKQINISGSLINHSEHKKMDFKEIKKIVEISKENNLKICVCSNNFSQIKKIDKLNPDFIAYEPTELIGTDISVAKSKPELIKKITNYCKSKILVGAGVKNKYDVKKSIELGSCGILVASGVIKSKNIKLEIEELLEGF